MGASVGVSVGATVGLTVGASVGALAMTLHRTVTGSLGRSVRKKDNVKSARDAQFIIDVVN